MYLKEIVQQKCNWFRIRTKPDDAEIRDIRDALDGVLAPMSKKERVQLFWQRVFLRTTDRAYRVY
jgi:hypothetical protein